MTREPVRFGSYTITYNPPPLPVRAYDWAFVHGDYDGAPDGDDDRCGHGASVEECRTLIREIEEWRGGTCPECGGLVNDDGMTVDPDLTCFNCKAD